MNKLRVWWIPQIPMNPFYVSVSSVEEAVKVMDVLSDYDRFQFENNIKPDYCNVGGLEMLETDVIPGFEEVWVDWYNEETGDDDPAEYLANNT